MSVHRMWTPLVVALSLLSSGLSSQGRTPSASEAAAFLGTWVIAMTNPAGATETVRIRDEKGALAASVQAGRFPPITASGVFKDGDVLLLSLTRFENGKPIYAVVALTVKEGVMNMAQMLEFSETIKRGAGKKQVEGSPARQRL
jgi:hypothetical protein